MTLNLHFKEGYEDLFKGKGHRAFTTAYLHLWGSIVQRSYTKELLLIDPLLDKVCHLSTGLSRWFLLFPSSKEMFIVLSKLASLPRSLSCLQIYCALFPFYCSDLWLECVLFYMLLPYGVFFRPYHTLVSYFYSCCLLKLGRPSDTEWQSDILHMDHLLTDVAYTVQLRCAELQICGHSDSLSYCD